MIMQVSKSQKEEMLVRINHRIHQKDLIENQGQSTLPTKKTTLLKIKMPWDNVSEQGPRSPKLKSVNRWMMKLKYRKLDPKETIFQLLHQKNPKNKNPRIIEKESKVLRFKTKIERSQKVKELHNTNQNRNRLLNKSLSTKNTSKSDLSQ